MNLFQPIVPSNNIFQSTNNYQNTWQQQPSSANRNPSPMQPAKNINGSYRGIFKQVKLDYLPPDPNAQGPAYSTTIISQPEYKGMVIISHNQDLIDGSSQQIDSNHKNLIQRACMQNRFEQKLISNTNIQNLIPPNFPNQTNRSTWNGYQNNTQTNNVFQQNNSQNNYQNPLYGSQRNPQSNTNIFQNNTTTTTPNLFQTQTQNTNMWAQPAQNTASIFTNSTNVFQQNPYQQTPYQSNPQQNLFQQPQQQQQNLFQQPSQTQNPFSQPQQQMNIFQNQQQPNIFNNQPGNIFSQPQQPVNIFQQPLQGGYPMMNNNNNNNMWMQRPMYPMMMPMNNSQMLQQAPAQIVEESVKSFLDYASMMAREYQRYVELKEMEQFNSEQQEIIIRENERISQMERMEREKKYTQKLEKQYNGHGSTRSPSPYSCSRMSNSNNSQRQSHISINHTFYKGNSPFKKSIISVTRSNVSTGKQLNIHVKFAESDNYYYQQIQRLSSAYQSVQSLKLDIITFLQGEKILTQDLARYRQFSKLYNTTNGLLDDNFPIQDLPQNLTILINQGKMPNLMKPGYSTEPSISTLDENNLCLQKFKIYNKYGSLEWENVDISYINFDRTVDIQDCEVTVYDESVIHQLLKPQQGDKLNKDCLITCSLNRFFNANQTSNIESMETKLKQMIKEIPATHYVGINQENFTFSIKVEHFTKYNFTDQFNDNFAENDDSYLQNQPNYRTKLVEVNFSDDENPELTVENDEILNQSQIPDQMEMEYRIKECGQKLEYLNEQFMEQQQQQQQQQPNKHKVELIRIKLFNERMYKETKSNYPFQENKKFPLGSPFDCLQSIEISESISKYFGKMKLVKGYNGKNQITERILKIFQSFGQIREEHSLKLINILFGNSCVDLKFYAQLLRYNEKCKIEDLNELKLDINHLIIPAFQKWFDELNKMSRQSLRYEEKLSSIEKVLKTTNKTTQNTEKDWRRAIFESRINLYSEDWWKNVYMQLQIMQISNLNQLILEIYLTIKFCEPISPKILKYLNKSNDQFVLILMHIILINRKDNFNEQIYRTIIINKISQLRQNAEVIFDILDMFSGLILGEREYIQLQQQIGKQFGAKQSRIKSEQIIGLIYDKDYEQAAQIAYDNNLIDDFKQICEQFVLPILVIENRDKELEEMMGKCNELGIQINLRELEIVNLYQYHMKQKLDKMKHD